MRLEPKRARVRISVAGALAVFLVSALDLGILAIPARADSARETLAQAEDDLAMADFASALETANRLLDSGDLSGDSERDAWVLKARAELGLARRSASIEAFCHALGIDPGWRPDFAFYTTDEREALAGALEACPPGEATQGEPKAYLPVSPGKKGKPWYENGKTQIALGGAVVLGLALLLASGGDDGGGGGGGEGPLPDVPDFPDTPDGARG